MFGYTRLAGCLVAACICLPATAVAADPRGDFAVRGIGLETCGAYAEQRAEQPALRMAARSWLNGYLTAYNQFVLDTYDVTAGKSLEELETGLEGYCQANPEHTISFAAIAVASSLDPARIRANPDKTSGRPKVASDTLRRIQQALKTRGHYKGAVDGVDGPGTRASLESFQRTEGLPVTRLPDSITLTRLFQ
jgi:hypothetical protein